MNTPMYAGLISEHLSGADLSWIVSLVVTSPLYYLLARRRRDQGERVAVMVSAQRVDTSSDKCG